MALVAGHDDADGAEAVGGGRGDNGEGNAGFGFGGLGGFVHEEGSPVQMHLGAIVLAVGVEGGCDAGLETGKIAVGDSCLDQDIRVATRRDHDPVAHQSGELGQGEQIAGRVAIRQEFSRDFGEGP